MKNVDVLSERYGVPKEDIFEFLLGQKNSILPGGLWHAYGAVLTESEMICHTATEENDFHIPYSSFEKAEFGIGNGNLWLQCQINGSFLAFCSPRKKWKSDAGKKLIEKISAVTPIQDMKEYERYTGKLFFLYMFK